MSSVDDKIRTPISQVVTGLISKKYNAITIGNLVIMHMNAERSSMTKEGKSKTSRETMSTSSSTMLLECASPIECNVIQESPCDIWYLDSGYNNHMTSKLNLFSILDNLVQIDVTLGNNVLVIVW